MARKWTAPVVISLFMFMATFLISCTGNNYTTAPLFTLTDNTGNKVNLADYKGRKAVLLLFFNFKIGTGQDPVLQSYLTRYMGVDNLKIFSVVNVAVLPEQGKQYMASQSKEHPGGLGYAVPLRDEDGSISQSFGANPDKLTLVLIDLEGRIRFRQEVTAIAEANTELAKQIEQLVSQR